MKDRALTKLVVVAALTLFVAACSEEEKPKPPKQKPKPTASVSLTSPTGRIAIGDSVVVSGEASAGTGELAYHWTLLPPEGSKADFLFEGQSRNRFEPDAGGTYKVQLVVEDEGGESEPAELEVLVDYAAPTAVLELSAPDPTVALDDAVSADGGKSHDPAGRPLTYTFQLTKTPPRSESVIVANGSKATFMPDRGGTYEVSLRVSNETTTSSVVTQEIVVDPPRNRPPEADAGKNRAGPVDAVAFLDGSASKDPDGDLLTYLWTFESKPEGSLAEIDKNDQARASFIPDLDGLYLVKLEVSDGEFTDEAIIEFLATITENVPPQIREVWVDNQKREDGYHEGVRLGRSVSIKAVIRDLDNGPGPLVLDWSLSAPDGSDAELVEVEENVRSLEGDEEGLYVVTLMANDGELDSPPFTLSFRYRGENKPPVAVITTGKEDHAFLNKTTITLDGSGSYDTDDPGDPIKTYEWRLIDQPPGQPTQTLTTPPSANPTTTFRLEKKTTERDYKFSLVVRDGGDPPLESEPTIITVKSLNNPPTAGVQTEWTAGLSEVHLSRTEPGEDDAPPLFGTPVVLNGARFVDGSTDEDGDELWFTWTLEDPPKGSNPLLQNPTSSATGFYTDMAGKYVVRMVVSDRDPLDPGEDEAEITINIYED